MVAIPGGLRTALTTADALVVPASWLSSADGFVDHLCSPFSAVLSVASCSSRVAGGNRTPRLSQNRT